MKIVDQMEKGGHLRDCQGRRQWNLDRNSRHDQSLKCQEGRYPSAVNRNVCSSRALTGYDRHSQSSEE